jgi:APA family basic amino acid/polyamine antiporter
MGTGDISEISIVFSYVCYSLLYLKVMQMKKEQTVTSVFKGIVCPVFALLGSAIILVGGIVSNPIYAPIFIVFCGVIAFAGIRYYRYNGLNQN